MKKTNARWIITLGILIAAEIILNRFFSVNTWNLKIGFSFVPVVLAAILYGPLSGGIVGGLGDFLGAILFPVGPYFPGFTITAFFIGASVGIFLHHRKSVVRIVSVVTVNQLCFSLLLNTVWIGILYNSPFVPLLFSRVVQCIILAPVQIVVIGLLVPALHSRRGGVST